MRKVFDVKIVSVPECWGYDDYGEPQDINRFHLEMTLDGVVYVSQETWLSRSEAEQAADDINTHMIPANWHNTVA